jgi:hypothetical protein
VSRRGYLAGNQSEGVAESVVAAEALKKHEDQDVDPDEDVVDDRGDRSVGIVVADGKHFRNPSLSYVQVSSFSPFSSRGT